MVSSERGFHADVQDAGRRGESLFPRINSPQFQVWSTWRGEPRRPADIPWWICMADRGPLRMRRRTSTREVLESRVVQAVPRTPTNFLKAMLLAKPSRVEASLRITVVVRKFGDGDQTYPPQRRTIKVVGTLGKDQIGAMRDGAGELGGELERVRGTPPMRNTGTPMTETVVPIGKP